MHKSRAEKHLAATLQLIEDKAAEADAILKGAEADDRDPSEDEESQIQGIFAEMKDLREKRDQYEAMVATEKDIAAKSGELEVTEVSVGQTREPQFKSLGDQFVESEQYRELIEGGLGQTWKMKAVELSTKATLTTTPGTALTPPSYQPGIVETLYQPPTVADLMPQAQAQASVIRYVQETAGSITNAAASVSEAASKPESRLAFEEVSEDVRKIATVLPVSDEMVSDYTAISGYINQRLSLFVRLKEDDLLMNGDGTAPNIRGFLNRSGINTYGRGTVDDNAEAIFKAANGTRGSSFLSPDAIVMNPANWQTTRLLQDSAGQFYGGGPFANGAYGGPNATLSASQFSADSIWGLRVIVTSAITANTALLGAFGQASMLWRKGGLTVDSTNAHSDFFYRNLTAIRAEERLAMAVYRPGAFTKITGLNQTIPPSGAAPRAAASPRPPPRKDT